MIALACRSAQHGAMNPRDIIWTHVLLAAILATLLWVAISDSAHF